VLCLVTAREIGRAHALEERQGASLRWKKPIAVAPAARSAPPAAMATLRIDAGRTDKLRPGDILGALTGDAGLPASAIGKIDIFATRSYVAIVRNQANNALARLDAGRIKGRNFRVRKI
jgi:ATP-independent RNA helicase DbpA